MKRVLVTGGAGFLGSHLCEYLIKKHYKVVCLDNLDTGSEDKISHLLEFENFEFVNADIVNPVDIYVDEIYNLACPASPIHYQSDPIKTIQTNVIGTKNLLELAKRNEAKILQASTSEIYGDPIIHPQEETYWGNVNCIGVRACYDEGKRVAETLFFEYLRQYNLEIKIARIFNTYGPRMQIDDGRAVANFIVQALKNKNITVYGAGMQTRSFCYVDDLIEALYKMMQTERRVTGPINIGNPMEITILDLAKRVIELTSSNSKIVFSELPMDDPKRRNPKIDLAQKELSWFPKVNIEDGLMKSITYFLNKV